MYRALGSSCHKRDGLGECVITAWEYAMGLERDVIGAGFGRRGRSNPASGGRAKSGQLCW